MIPILSNIEKLLEEILIPVDTGSQISLTRSKEMLNGFTNVNSSMEGRRINPIYIRIKQSVGGSLANGSKKMQTPIYYAIITLMDAEKRYSTMEKLVLA